MKQKKKIARKSKSVRIHKKISKKLLIGLGILFITLFIIVAASTQHQSLLGDAQTTISPTFFQIGDCQANGNCPTGSAAPVITNAVSSNPSSSIISASPTSPASVSPCVSAANAPVSIMAKHRKNGNNGIGNGNGNGFIQIILQFFQMILQLLQQLFGGSTGTVPPPVSNQPTQAVPSGVQPSSGPNPSQAPCPPAGSPAPTVPVQQQPTTPPAPTNRPTTGAVPTTPVSSSCTNPTHVLPMNPSNPQDGITIGNFYITNDTWNAAKYQVSQTMSICDYNNWFVTATMNDTGDGAVKTYPNVHEDVNNKAVSSYNTITSTFAESGPHVGIYEYAYDLWLNNYGIEVMIWNDNFHQTPSGSKKGTFTDNGHTYDVYDSGGGYIAFVAQSNFTSGTVNILNFFKYLSANGMAPSNSTVTQLDYGIELVSTGGSPATFKVTNFSLTAN